jgi:hypothetical protein
MKQVKHSTRILRGLVDSKTFYARKTAGLLLHEAIRQSRAYRASGARAIIQSSAKITNGQLSFEDSGKCLAATVLSLLKDLSTFEYKSTRGYDRRAQLDFAAFQYLVCTISNFRVEENRG